MSPPFAPLEEVVTHSSNTGDVWCRWGRAALLHHSGVCLCVCAGGHSLWRWQLTVWCVCLISTCSSQTGCQGHCCAVNIDLSPRQMGQLRHCCTHIYNQPLVFRCRTRRRSCRISCPASAVNRAETPRSISCWSAAWTSSSEGEWHPARHSGCTGSSSTHSTGFSNAYATSSSGSSTSSLRGFPLHGSQHHSEWFHFLFVSIRHHISNWSFSFILCVVLPPPGWPILRRVWRVPSWTRRTLWPRHRRSWSSFPAWASLLVRRSSSSKRSQKSCCRRSFR